MKILTWFKKLVKSQNFWPLLIVIVSAILASRTLLFEKGYFIMHDDLQMMRQLEMEKCFLDGQIPCRWIPDMGYGYGFPLFNYYPPLPYLIGEVFRVVGFSFVDVPKIVFALSIIVSGVTMYFLAKEFFGRKGGILSSIFYVWAPYHSVDIYVRGAMNEAWALSWFPLILWTSYKLITGEKKKPISWIIALGLSWFALLTSHNLMVLIFTPVFAVWCLIFLWRGKLWSRVPQLIISGALAFGLAAFFTLPAILEQKYVQVNTLVIGYYEYIAHFATLNQLLFSRFWGYGPSIWGNDDGMPFPVGHYHWILSLVIAGFILFKLYKSKKKDLLKNPLFLVIFFVAIGWASTFMTHSRSTFIWQHLPPLKFVQFPWRFLTLTTLSFSFIAGSVVLFLNKKIAKWVVGLLALGVIAFNWNYFLPKNGKMGPLTEKEKFSDAAWDLQRTAGIFDYLPVTAKENAKEPPKTLAEIMKGKAEVSNPSQGTKWAKFQINVDSDEVVARIGIFYFPKWRAFVDGKETEVYVDPEEKWGRMYLNIPKGEHQVELKLFSTPLRIFSNIISLVTWLALLSFPLWSKKMVKLNRE